MLSQSTSYAELVRNESRSARIGDTSCLDWQPYPGGFCEPSMKKTIAYFFAAGAVVCISAAQAQGISNARDGNGNLVERGATTRSYPTPPMANSHVAAPPLHGYVASSRPHAVVIRAR